MMGREEVQSELASLRRRVMADKPASDLEDRESLSVRLDEAIARVAELVGETTRTEVRKNRAQVWFWTVMGAVAVAGVVAQLIPFGSGWRTDAQRTALTLEVDSLRTAVALADSQFAGLQASADSMRALLPTGEIRDALDLVRGLRAELDRVTDEAETTEARLRGELTVARDQLTAIRRGRLLDQLFVECVTGPSTAVVNGQRVSTGGRVSLEDGSVTLTSIRQPERRNTPTGTPGVSIEQPTVLTFSVLGTPARIEWRPRDMARALDIESCF